MKDLQLLKYPASGQAISASDTDIEIDPTNGDFVWLSGHDRKRQDIVKMLLTVAASNPVFQNYGTLISKARGRSQSDIEKRIKDSVYQGLAYLQAIETSSLPSERIQALKSLSVEKSATNKQAIIIKLSVILEDDYVVIIEFPQ